MLAELGCGAGGRQSVEVQRITGPAGRDEGREIGWRGQAKEGWSVG